MRRTIAIAVPYTPLISRAAVVMCGIIALSLFLYGAFLLGAVSHTAKRADMGREVTKLTEVVSKLEVKYLTETKSLTPARAAALGFVEPSKVNTVFAAGEKFSFHE